MNLLINAVEATSSGGEVKMSFAEDAKGLCVMVKDTGEGMTEKQLAMVTEPFYTTKTTGTGLGLAVSLCLAKQNHAELGFDSKPGHGTTVTMRFEKDFICEPETNTVNY
jgi:two-component system sporulation sensor kinase B